MDCVWEGEGEICAPIEKGEEDDVDDAEIEGEEEHDGLETKNKRALEVFL